MQLPKDANYRLEVTNVPNFFGWVTVDGKPLRLYDARVEGLKTVALFEQREELEGKKFEVVLADMSTKAPKNSYVTEVLVNGKGRDTNKTYTYRRHPGFDWSLQNDWRYAETKDSEEFHFPTPFDSSSNTRLQIVYHRVQGDKDGKISKWVDGRSRPQAFLEFRAVSKDYLKGKKLLENQVPSPLLKPTPRKKVVKSAPKQTIPFTAVLRKSLAAPVDRAPISLEPIASTSQHTLDSARIVATTSTPAPGLSVQQTYVRPLDRLFPASRVPVLDLVTPDISPDNSRTPSPVHPTPPPSSASSSSAVLPGEASPELFPSASSSSVQPHQPRLPTSHSLATPFPSTTPSSSPKPKPKRSPSPSTSTFASVFLPPHPRSRAQITSDLADKQDELKEFELQLAIAQKKGEVRRLKRAYERAKEEEAEKEARREEGKKREEDEREEKRVK